MYLEEWRHMKHRSTVFLLATAAACAGSGDMPPDSSATSNVPPSEVTITARDFAFTMPDSVPSGWTKITLVNEGPQLHHAQLVRFDDGKTLADFEAALKAGGPPPTWVHDAGGPNPPPDGGSASTMQNLEPGQYAVVCFVDLPDRVPHIMKGMSKAFVVTPSATTVAEPSSSVTITIADYSFATSTPLTTGKHTVKVVNNGPQSHEVAFFRLNDGKTVEDFMKFAESYQGAPPGMSVGGIAGVPPGSNTYFDVDLTPGEYILICFVPDAKDGKPHVAHGMMQRVTIS